jgi:hypothetical protein
LVSLALGPQLIQAKITRKTRRQSNLPLVQSLEQRKHCNSAEAVLQLAKAALQQRASNIVQLRSA